MWRAALLLCVLAGTLGAQEDEGVKVVRKLSFSGNHAIGEKELRAAIATSQAPLLYRLSFTRWIGLAKPPVFDEMEFRRDVLRVQALYGVRGYPDAVVDTTIRKKGNVLDLTIRITEGEPIVVDSVIIAGLDTIGNYVKRLPLQAGQPFNRLAFQTSISVLEALLRDRGHAFARVTGGFRASEDAKSVVVTLTAEPGPRARIGRIEVAGNEAIDKRVILKTLMLKEGQVFSDSALHEGMMNLQRTELFRQVRLGFSDSGATRSNPGDSLIEVWVRAQLAEYPLRRARVAAGYGTLDCLRAMGSVDLFNFSGKGRRLEFRARTSQIAVHELQNSLCGASRDEDTSRVKLNYNFAMTLHDPLLGWNQTTAMATVFFERRTEFGAYLREALGGEVALTRQIATDLPLEASYSLSYGRTVAAPATFCVLLNVCTFEDQAIFRQRRLRSVLGFSLVRDGTNSVNDATRGNLLVTELRVSPSFLGSDRYMRFARATAGFTSHHQFGPDSLGRVISWRIRGGWVLAPRDEVPFEERFFTGGSTTVRGFGENQLGPVVYVVNQDSTIRTSATGGTYMGVANVEARFPLNVLGIQLFGAVFADAGYIDNLRITPGVGVRMPSLLGPIRLDLAFNPYAARTGPLYAQSGTDLTLVNASYQPQRRFIDRLQLHLSIGQAF